MTKSKWQVTKSLLLGWPKLCWFQLYCSKNIWSISLIIARHVTRYTHIITPARAAQSAARRAYNNRVPIPRARARQPRFDSSMQYCIRSLISITNVQKCCKRAKVCASLLLWHFKTIWIENICLPFIEVHCSNQQKLVHFAHRGFSNFLISTQNFNKWRPNVGINILVLTNA